MPVSFDGENRNSFWKYETGSYINLPVCNVIISGLKVFDGEDLEFQDRKQFQQMQQDEWFKQQLYENQNEKTKN